MKHMLCLDIGGTNPRMAMMQIKNKEISLLKQEPVHGHSLIDAMNHFLKTCGEHGWTTDTCIAAAAGPIDYERNECRTPTHARYPVIGREIQQRTYCKNILVINDFEAIGHAVAIIDPSSCTPIIDKPYKTKSVRATIGPGTGLGVSYLTWDDEYIIHGSEGGHQSIDCGDDKLASFIRKHHPQITAETFLSGEGIKKLTKYYLSFPPKTHHRDISRLKQEIKESEDIAAAVAQSTTKTAQRIMNDFMRILGRYAQDIALHYLPEGGIFLAGGILQKNKTYLLNGTFSHAFKEIQYESSKTFISKIPVYLIDDYDISFYGCARAGILKFQ